MENNYHNNPENENFLFGKDKKLPFIVPDGYFDSFALLLIRKIEVMEEIREFSALSDIPKLQSYIVPENYFSASANKLELTCELSDFSLLSSIPKRTLKPVAEEVSDVTEELEGFAMLSALKKENRFAVSPDYFENSADQIKAVVQESVKKEAKVIPLFLRPKMLMAYAAVILIAVCAVFYVNSQKQQMITGDCHTLACLEKNEILNERTISDFNEEDLYEMVDADQLDVQLSKADSTEENKK
jgi:hypothetical protein